MKDPYNKQCVNIPLMVVDDTSNGVWCYPLKPFHVECDRDIVVNKLKHCFISSDGNEISELSILFTGKPLEVEMYGVYYTLYYRYYACR